MKKLTRNINLFFYKNRNKGIPNLMLYVCIGAALVYAFTLLTDNYIVAAFLVFDRGLILQGQVWRLISYPLVYGLGGYPVLVLLSLFFFYQLSRSVEQVWGCLRMNLYYLIGIVLTDIYCMIFGCQADVTYLNLSIILAFCTLYPDATFRILFIIPAKAWVLALIDLGLIVLGIFTTGFPDNLLPVVALVNYFLFFGSGVLNLLPLSWRRKMASKPRKAAPKPTGTIPLRQEPQKKAPAYTHRCTVCGRTDVSDPQLEFRYCSRCNGYFCYCEDHINNHEHVQ